MERENSMSIKNGKDYLYLVWKCASTRRQYIVGQLAKNGQYEFCYCEEIEEACKAGFKLLISFEEKDKVYTSKELFPVFSSRLPDRKRKDMSRILEKYGLESYDSYELLKKSGAKLPIDNLQFIDPILDFENEFEKTFYLAGVRHYLGCDGAECSSAISATRGDEVFLKREQDNPHDKNAICVVNDKQERLGYIPRYYAQAFVSFMENKRIMQCHVASVEKAGCCDECISIVVKISGINS